MKYCENCNVLVKEDICALCGNKKIREVTAEDYCFLTQCDTFLGDMLDGLMKEENIQGAFVPFGDGVRSQFALPLGQYRVYVRYKDYDTSVELLKVLKNERSTDELREDILANIDKWDVKTNEEMRRFVKKWKLSTKEEIIAAVKEIVEKADKIEDRGIISSFAENGLLVTAGKIKVWISAETYQLAI